MFKRNDIYACNDKSCPSNTPAEKRRRAELKQREAKALKQLSKWGMPTKTEILIYRIKRFFGVHVR